MHLFKYNDNVKFYTLHVYCITSNYIEQMHDSVCHVYIHCTTQVNVTSRYLYVPGQGSPPRTPFETVILQLFCPSHLLLTTVSDEADWQSVDLIWGWGQTFPPSVLPKTASWMLILPSGQRNSNFPPSHTITVFFTLKKTM